MKKKILFSILGGIILFVWEFLSFAMPNFHRSESAYTPVQDSLLAKINQLGIKEGMYVLGQGDPSLSMADQEKQVEKYANKPWAVLNYHEQMSMDMVIPMIRGFLVSVVICFFLFWLFLQQKEPTLNKRLLLALAVGLIGFFYHPYTSHIWYKEPGIFAHFADGIIPWLILGLLGNKMAKQA